MKAEDLIARTGNLRAPSPTVSRLLHLLSDSEADYTEVIATIGRDMVLTGKLLALCNSAAYGLARPVASLKEGVHYLGFVEIHRNVMRLGFGETIGVELPGYDMGAGELWEHSLAAAKFAPLVTRLSRTQKTDTAVAFTAGLMHDIGKVVIGQTLDCETRKSIRALVDQESASALDAERAVLGCDHAEIGACLLRQWRIPEVLVEAVANHHQPGRNPGAPLAAIVHAADAIAHQTGASPGWGSFAIRIDEGALKALNLSGEDIERLSIAATEPAAGAHLKGDTTLSRKDAPSAARPSF